MASKVHSQAGGDGTGIGTGSGLVLVFASTVPPC